MLVASEILTMTALLEYLNLLQQEISQKGGKGEGGGQSPLPPPIQLHHLCIIIFH